MVEQFASIVIIAFCWGLEKSLGGWFTRGQSCLEASASILWNGRNRNGKVVALSPLAPPSWDYSNVPLDPLTLHLPAFLLLQTLLGFLPYGGRALEYQMAFSLFFIFVRGKSVLWFIRKMDQLIDGFF